MNGIEGGINREIYSGAFAVTTNKLL